VTTAGAGMTLAGAGMTFSASKIVPRWLVEVLLRWF